MQRGAAHRGAADEDRRQLRHGRQLAGAAHLHRDVFHLRHAGLGREFVGDGPARRAARVAQPLLRGVRIHFQNHAIDLVAQRGALALGVVDKLHHLVDGAHALTMRIHAKAERGERIERSRLPRGKILAVDEQKIGEENQPPIGDDARAPACAAFPRRSCAD